MNSGRLVIVRSNDVLLRPLKGFPTPMLIDQCNDGKPHEAWPYRLSESGGPQWRARDDAFDAIHKPADVPYTLVRVGYLPDDD